jgi:hypothetical protein
MLALVVTLLLATAVGLAARRRNGRLRPVRPLADAPAGHREPSLSVPGAHTTFVQISAAHCAVCPSVARALRGVAADTPGVAHLELRAEEHLDLVRRYDVRRSPTVLLVDADGAVVARTSGAMTAVQARDALAARPARLRTADHLEEPVDARV